MAPCLFVISGLPGSGKTTAANFFHKRGFKVFSMGELTGRIIRLCGFSLDEEHEKTVRTRLRKILGKEVYAVFALKRIKDLLNAKEKVVVEGLRSIEELATIKQFFPETKSIFIDVPEELRHLRLSGRKQRKLDMKEARARDREELLVLGLKKIMEIADFKIDNSGTKKSLDNIIKDITKGL